ncbi:hypothetical protein AHS86_23830 [Salmonella enterica subsp. enterica]|uniref:FidL-like membrane protein n=1 Tax=Salmonella bongori N268-08 TaxID=1197719 RepID=S5N4E0_SALBN|nr:hypothetical protein A464_plas0099 [Salmonella bongori N268-08]EAA2737277.1 hypothetical protein [Salmonella enterica subsp. enterica serovar Reading]EAA8634498.1 hypothetical protein [Salmonella enterica subsp. enterica]EAA9933548.1 hypothetical protein [Salmonella enterica subsp. salamae]EBI8251224.1 hypothetical protein [Salmonella enterica]EBQ8981045.1 hypothetical protein [Salmonella enterica subsp. enterica serovar Albany]EBW6452675.1 hypothetical protein [Salmonella enterica subsp. 
MCKKLPALLFFISTIIFLSMAVFAAYSKMSKDHHILCLANQSTIHGDFLMQGEFDFLFQKGRGRVRINGSTDVGEKENIVSRQIFFTYTHQGDDFVLLSQQVQMMNNGDTTIANSEFNSHFPAFFSQEEKQLAMAIRLDRSGNFVMYFANVPVFYCQPKT